MTDTDKWLAMAYKTYITEVEMCFRRAVLRKDNPMTIEEASQHLEKTLRHVSSEWFREYAQR